MTKKYRVMMMMEVAVEVDDAELDHGMDIQDLIRPQLLELEEQLDELGINMGGIESVEPAEGE